jgi:hypothetical protein
VNESQCLLLALSGHAIPANECLLLGEERTLDGKAAMSLSGPKADIQHVHDYFFILIYFKDASGKSAGSARKI